MASMIHMSASEAICKGFQRIVIEFATDVFDDVERRQRQPQHDGVDDPVHDREGDPEDRVADTATPQVQRWEEREKQCDGVQRPEEDDDGPPAEPLDIGFHNAISCCLLSSCGTLTYAR